MTRKERICLDYIREHGGALEGSAISGSPSMSALIARGLVEVSEGPPLTLRVNEANVRREAEEV